jgi:uncharacterized membrane protein
MTKKQYQICRLAIIIVLSFSISFAINLGNYYLPLVFMATAMAGMYYCRKQLQTKDVLVDERDYKQAGDAARYAITIYAFVGAIGTFVLMGISEGSGNIYDLSQYLAFSVCILMLLNAFIFRYLRTKGK